MTYVQGFLLPVKTAKKEAYRQMAADFAPIFLEHGALRNVECWGDDVMDGARTDMKKAVKLEPDETVVFSWIVYADKAAAERAHDALIADERMAAITDPMFNPSRMIFAGFDVVHDSGPDQNGGAAFGYVDGVVARVPSGDPQQVAEFEAATTPIFTDKGALRLVGAVASDIKPGKTTDFLSAVAASEGDIITFGWIEWPDRATRDAGMGSLRQDERMATITPAWDGPTAIFGGFVPIFDSDRDLGGR